MYKLNYMFASHGLPAQIVSDNGPQFVSEEFAVFLKANGVRHFKCAPYHPASNGLAERFVRTFKQVMKAGKRDGLASQHQLENFLFTYRTTPQATTRTSPCSLFLGWDLRTKLDLLHPDVERQVHEKQAAQKRQHDRHDLCVKDSSVSVWPHVYRHTDIFCVSVVVQFFGSKSKRSLSLLVYHTTILYINM